MIYLTYKCKVNFVKLPLIWTDLRLKLSTSRETPCIYIYIGSLQRLYFQQLASMTELK